MGSSSVVRNVGRYSAIAAVISGLSALYYGSGAFLVFGFLIPGLVASVLLVRLIPRRQPTLIYRLAAVVVSTFVSYAAVAISQTAAGFADLPPSVSPWSPTYAVTFLGLLTGFVFGWVALLRPKPFETATANPRI
jgi:hypothetical protein